MPYLGHTNTKKLVVYLKFKFSTLQFYLLNLTTQLHPRPLGRGSCEIHWI